MADGDRSPDRYDRISKLAVPIVGSILIAAIAFLADSALTSFAARQENARLITNLQIQREQAESDLRRDVFHQAIGALLSEDELRKSDLALTKRLLKLELLALNFGNTLSLAPLFGEFDRDLEKLERAARGDLNQELRLKSLRRRLRRLARKLASDQLSALEQYGVVRSLRADLAPGGRKYDRHAGEYSWPDDPVRASYGDPEDIGETYEAEVDTEKRRRGELSLGGIKRYLTVTLGKIDVARKTVAVDLEVCWNPERDKQRYDCNEAGDESVQRQFTLDFFNFPKIDNTRLSDNQRMGMILEAFDTSENGGTIEVAAVIFPAEHASLRDRPSMMEAVKLLNSVLDSQGAAATSDPPADSATGKKGGS